MTEKKTKKGIKLLGKILFGALAAYGAAELLGSLIAWGLMLYYKNTTMNVGMSASIGVIGGADGPTAVFVTTPGWMHYITPVLLLMIGIWGLIRLRKRKEK